jgi:hypothetical protein
LHVVVAVAAVYCVLYWEYEFSTREAIANAILSTLAFPIFWLPLGEPNPMLGIPLLIVNALLWGTVFVLVWSGVRRLTSGCS